MSSKKNTFYLNFSEIVPRMLKKAELSHYKELAEVLEISPQAIANFKRTGRFPINLVVKFAIKNKFSVDYLLNLQGEDTQPETMKYLIRIPYVQPLNKETQNETIKIIMELKKTCIQFGFSENISDLVVWQINGDNMAPNINRKDFLLINTRVKQIDGSGIYAFLDDTKVIIRRVKEGLNGKIDLINDNSAYQGYENIQMLNFEIGNLEVLGRVVFVGKIL